MSKFNNLDYVKWLYEHGCPCDHTTSLETCGKDIVDYLISHDFPCVDVNVIVKNNILPLLKQPGLLLTNELCSIVITHGSCGCLKFLLDLGYRLDHEDDYFMALQNCTHNIFKIKKLLQSYMIRIPYTCSCGQLFAKYCDNQCCGQCCGGCSFHHH
jgi:hypothetical protein